ncbi:hypothetical protein JB92DRAFT_160775 [Gautieria morchelliformis]|nr:hypothetical protein JB92DRAFT_160775 [Gautieria morchelliformis]
MSLTRQRVLALSRRSTCIPLAATQLRLSSSDPHSHHDDANVYPQESFNTPFWRTTALLTLLGIGLYNLVPYIDKDKTYITRYIQHYATPRDVWARINDKHLELSADAAQGQLLIGSATRPHILRMRYPAALEYASPHNVAVGSQTDMSHVVVKKDNSWAD